MLSVGEPSEPVLCWVDGRGRKPSGSAPHSEGLGQPLSSIFALIYSFPGGLERDQVQSPSHEHRAGAGLKTAKKSGRSKGTPRSREPLPVLSLCSPVLFSPTVRQARRPSGKRSSLIWPDCTWSRQMSLIIHSLPRTWGGVGGGAVLQGARTL